MGGAVAGTIIGYPIGVAIEKPLNSIMNPWYRQQWRDIGMGMSSYIPRNYLPSWIAGSSAVQEITGSTVQQGLDKKK